jgi:hypothetical protein
VVFVRESLLNGGRPILEGVTVSGKLVKAHMFPSTLIDPVTVNAYSKRYRLRRQQWLSADAAYQWRGTNFLESSTA